jgi:hypothetical protein
VWVEVAVATAVLVAGVSGVGVSVGSVGVGGQPLRAAFTAAISSSMVTEPLALGSNAAQSRSGARPSAMLNADDQLIDRHATARVAIADALGFRPTGDSQDEGRDAQAERR